MDNHTGTPVRGFDSIEEWANANDWELDDVLWEGVSQDDDGVIWVPDTFPATYSERKE